MGEYSNDAGAYNEASIRAYVEKLERERSEEIYADKVKNGEGIWVPREKQDADENADEEVSATPAAEAKAEELGVDLTEVEPSGAQGDVLVKDVEAAAPESSKETSKKSK